MNRKQTPWYIGILSIILVFLFLGMCQTDPLQIPLPDYGTFTTATSSTDTTGTESTSSQTSTSSSIIDLTAPQITQLTIENNASTTTDLIVKVAVIAEDDVAVTEISTSNDGTTWSDWLTYSPLLWEYELETGDYGNREVYVKVRDASGKESQVNSASIEYVFVTDTEPPVVSNVLMQGGASETSSLTIDVLIMAFDNEGVTDYIISNDVDFGDDNWASYTPEIFSHELSAGEEGYRSVWVKVRDAAGNETQFGPTSILYTLDAIYVSISTGDDENPGTKDEPVKTIGQGINLANQKNGRVYVEEGEYNEDITITSTSVYGGYDLTWNESVRTKSIIRGAGNASYNRTVWFIGAPERVVFDGFEIYTSTANPSPASYGVGFSNTSKGTLQNCIIYGAYQYNFNSRDENAAIFIEGASVPLIQDCEIIGTFNTQNYGIGILITDPNTAPEITNCTIFGSYSTDTDVKYGIHVTNGAEPHIHDNPLIMGSNQDVSSWGIYLEQAGSAIIENNTLIAGSYKGGGRIGIMIDSILDGAEIKIQNNQKIYGAYNETNEGSGTGIYIRNDLGAVDNTITVSGNGVIQGGFDGWCTGFRLYNVTGGTINVTGNTHIVGKENGPAANDCWGFYVDNPGTPYTSGVINVTQNENIVAAKGATVYGRYIAAFYFLNDINNITLNVSDNTRIVGSETNTSSYNRGFFFDGQVIDCDITINNNERIQGSETSGAYVFFFDNTVTGGTHTYSGNTLLLGSTTGSSTVFRYDGVVTNTTINIRENTEIKGSVNTSSHAIMIGNGSNADNTIDIVENQKIMCSEHGTGSGGTYYGINVNNENATTNITDNVEILGNAGYSVTRTIYFGRHDTINILRNGTIKGTHQSSNGYAISTDYDFRAAPINVYIKENGLIQGGVNSTSYGILLDYYQTGVVEIEDNTTIKGATENQGRAIYMDACSGVTVKINNNDSIIGSDGNGNSYGVYLTGSNQNFAMDNIWEVTNNTLIKGSETGNGSYGVYIYEEQNGRNYHNALIDGNTTIQGSTSGNDSYGVYSYLRYGNTGGTDVTIDISNNTTIKGTATGGGTSYGIYLRNMDGGAGASTTIDANGLIIGNDGVVDSTGYGIYADYPGPNFTISNTTTAIKGTGTTYTAHSGYGIYMHNYNRTCDLVIDNNPLIIGVDASTNHQAEWGVGIYMYAFQASSTTITNNTMIKGTSNTYKTTQAYGIWDRENGSYNSDKGNFTLTQPIGGGKIIASDGDVGYARGADLEGPFGDVVIDISEIIGCVGNSESTGSSTIGFYTWQPHTSMDLTFDKIMAVGGDCGYYSYGILISEDEVAHGDITLTGNGEMIGTQGDNWGGYGYAAYFDGTSNSDIDITGNMSFTGVGGDGNRGYGIYFDNPHDHLTLSGAMDIVGLVGNGNIGYGIYVNQSQNLSIDINGAMKVWGAGGTVDEAIGMYFPTSQPATVIDGLTEIKATNGAVTNSNWSYGIYFESGSNQSVTIQNCTDIIGSEGDAQYAMGIRVYGTPKLNITDNTNIIGVKGNNTGDAYGVYVSTIEAGGAAGENNITGNTLIKGSGKQVFRQYVDALHINSTVHSPLDIKNNTFIGTEDAFSTVNGCRGIMLNSPTGNSVVTIEDNTITAAKSGAGAEFPEYNSLQLAGIYVGGAQATQIIHNTIVGNEAGPGVGIYCNNLLNVAGKSFDITRNKIWGSKGNANGSWGVYFYDVNETLSESPIISNNIIKGNNGSGIRGKGLYIYDGLDNDFRVSNNILYGGAGGDSVYNCSTGFMYYNCQPYIVNNIMYNSDGYDFNFAMREYSSDANAMEIKNNIVFSYNTGLEYHTYYIHDTVGDGEHITDFADFTTGNTGVGAMSGNIGTVSAATSLFTNPATNDYTLKTGSAAIDAGIDTSSATYGSVTVDINGSARSGTYDIGPYAN